MNRFIVIILTIVNIIQCDISLRLRLENFSNNFGLTQHNEPCTNNKCSTYFKLCLRAAQDNCVAEFRTELLGDNTISEQQFKLTTDSIEFLITNEYLQQTGNQITVQIEALNNEQTLIDQYNLIFKNNITTNEWFKFEASTHEHSIQLAYELRCIKNFYGLNCEKNINCELNCQNNGLCVLNQDSKPQCKCNTNLYSGNLCQIKLLKQCATSDSCLNGGSCLATNECLCPPGYTGNKCQHKKLTSQCGPVTCYNGGTCMIDNQNDYKCLCHQSFTGRLCDVKIDLCELRQPCANGAKCVSNQFQTDYKCECLNGFSGKNCDQFMTSKPLKEELKQSFSFKEICLIVLLGVALPILAILLTVVLCRFRSAKLDYLDDESLSCKNKDFDQIDSDKLKPTMSFINNNLFDAVKDVSNEKKLCINTISSTICFNTENKLDNLKSNTKFYNEYEYFNTKSFDKHSNESFKVMASIV